ncbi:UDP-2,3-diacylglucosamine diphosphatase [Flavobacterium sp. N1994]|uniref:UDP-2,3-diacylglucosamine diphosphatase n=1 Tax=Flavobacterium sp. N1994 TaxID=2986827 RepID=UPI0022230025|nr:UDP-2,3-diacylglucosamine diphosphatase [Flavobacterium sp. N1994]
MPKTKKRKIDLLVLSDIHLGTYGCQSKELLNYMNSVKPKMVVLNGDIIDIWQFSKRYWPKSHMQVIHKLFNWMSKGVKIYYITGNHDEMLRKFESFKMGKLSIENKLVLDLDGKKTWIFHGDVFDVTMQHSKWLTKLGSHGYDLLILINAVCNWVSVKMGKGKISLSKNIKNSVKTAVKFVNDFEKTAADIAISNGYDYVLCGHIHQPEMKTITTSHGNVEYLNSGDWIENLTALEYNNKEWSLYKYNPEAFSKATLEANEDELVLMENEQIFNQMLGSFLEKKDIITPIKFK